MNGLTAYALSKKYTEQSLLGAGALKGEKGDDGASIKAISITQDSTGRITDAIATLSDNSTIKIEIISEIPPEERLDGDGSEYYTLAPAALSFRSTAPLNELQEVQINGVTVDPANYTLEEGSTIVTFPIDYLKTLDTGNYEVVIASESKSVKGEFTVKAPELNEHGFYYNQPYIAYVEAFGGNTAVFIRNDGTLDLIVIDTGYIESCTYNIADNQLTITAAMGIFTASFSDNGNTVFVNELAISFILGNESIVADNDYIYIYKEDLGGYEVNAIDKTKAEYGAIKTGINGIDTMALADCMFTDNSNLVNAPKIPSTVADLGWRTFKGCKCLMNIEIPNGITEIPEGAFQECVLLTNIIIPDSVTSISSYAFDYCTKLAAIDIPDSVTRIDSYAFEHCFKLMQVKIPKGVAAISGYTFYSCSSMTSVIIHDGVTQINNMAFGKCSNLTSITFEGTMKQWASISKERDWSSQVLATYVQCSDGTVSLV